MLDDILKNMALFIDGRGYGGNVEELTLPKLTLKTEEFRGGGMDAPIEIDMGMEKLECEFTLTRFDKQVLKLFGVVPGKLIPLTVRGALVSVSGEQVSVIVTMQGIIREMELGNWKPGEKATLKFMVGLSYYKLVQGGEIIHEIDIPNMVRTIGGVDQLAAMRIALGI